MFIIIITSNSSDPYNVGKLYKTEEEAEEGLKQYRKGWGEWEWRKLEGHIIKVKGL
tara:strand:- start:488 stop:655 length:168 start_codon:yes stop_codon:yes gene_type:complete